MTPRRASGAGFKLATLGLTLLPLACSEEVSQPTPSASAVVVRRPLEAPADAGADAAPAPIADYQEKEWAESERSRDPFRSFESLFVEEARGQIQSQREVVLDQYTIDELRLIGIVTRVHPERAMLVDPTGKGHVVQRGQLIGKAEVVQIAGQTGKSFEINWRVDRVRDGDIVLVREDPQNPDLPSATRVIALRPDNAAERAAIQ